MTKNIIIKGLKNIVYIIENKVYHNLKQIYLLCPNFLSIEIKDELKDL
jgi:hypothetical protein